ncbi:MAG: hypothetical protein LBR93_05360 [Treponema sp.]|jgi:hypothetical protein|nr:hypothetical protein [Treponema sp.]
MRHINAYCLLNHPLTANQIAELESRFGVERVVYPGPELGAAWGKVPAEKTLPAAYLLPFVRWLSALKKGDVVILQGEAGATFALVDFVLARGFTALHSVTRRVARESREGEKVFRSHVFEHVCFRRYAGLAPFPPP